MIEALWSVVFVASQNQVGSGVAVLETGRILGGDAQYYYVGTYSIEGGEMTAFVTITHFAGEPLSVFGPSTRHELVLNGKTSHDKFILTGTTKGNPSQIIAIELTRRAELP